MDDEIKHEARNEGHQKGNKAPGNANRALVAHLDGHPKGISIVRYKNPSGFWGRAPIILYRSSHPAIRTPLAFSPRDTCEDDRQ